MMSSIPHRGIALVPEEDEEAKQAWKAAVVPQRRARDDGMPQGTGM